MISTLYSTNQILKKDKTCDIEHTVRIILSNCNEIVQTLFVHFTEIFEIQEIKQ